MPPEYTPVFIVRFWAKVNKDGPLPAHRPDLGPCWLWTGAQSGGKAGRRYGHLKARRLGGKLYAHRTAYELLAGPIADGLDLDHLCKTPLCVNPAHLEPVSQRVNVLRSDAPAAVNARRTHCHNGHPFDKANTYTSATGYRTCRTCRLAYLREWRRKKVAHVG